MRFSGELTHICCLQRSVLISCCISEAGWMVLVSELLEMLTTLAGAFSDVD